MGNKHSQPFRHTAGETGVSGCGMNTDDLLDTDIVAVHALIAKHRLSERLGTRAPEDPGWTPADGPPSQLCLVDLTNNNEIMILNYDDEQMVTFDDATIPGAFIIELMQLLAAVAYRDIAQSDVDWMIEAYRKGVAITCETQPTWADYTQLLTS